jgi:hypothetical protein
VPFSVPTLMAMMLGSIQLPLTPPWEVQTSVLVPAEASVADPLNAKWVRAPGASGMPMTPAWPTRRPPCGASQL